MTKCPFPLSNLPFGLVEHVDKACCPVWVDLRPFLSARDADIGGGWDAESRLWDALANAHGVLLVPGSLCGCGEPGFFRVAVAGEFETLREGLDRLERGIRRFVNDDTSYRLG